MDALRVRIPRDSRDRGYDVLVGEGLLSRLGREVARREIGDAAFVVSSPRILSLHGAAAKGGLRSGGVREIRAASIPDGEAAKNLRSYGELMRRLAGFDDGERRRVFVACLGGGVVGDVGGFVAATYRRGTPCVQIPTTLLSMVDSAVGGKTGVDLLAKNQVGAFHQPALVVADLGCLKTLPAAELRSGLAEVIKCAVIADAAFFRFLEENLARILSLEAAPLSRAVRRSVEIKAAAVARDEFDRTGRRASLNLGHTIGHALEAAAGYGLRHGECVAIGMCAAADLAVSLGILDAAAARRIEALVLAAGLPSRGGRVPPSKALSLLKHDKKFRGGGNRFVLPVRIGRVVLRERVDPRLVRRAVGGRVG